MSDGVEIPITTPGGAEGAAVLRALAKAMKDLGEETENAGKKGDVAKSAWKFNEISEAISRAHERITQFADAVSALSSEQAQLDANSARLGLDFNRAADAAGRFTDETEAMGAATRLAEAGINLTQTQLDSLTRVAARFAQNTGGTVASAIDTLTNGLITGSQRGLRPFGDELARAGGNSHTAEQRLHALTEQAKHTEKATDDAASSMARFRDSIDDASRTLAHGFAEGVMRMAEFGGEADDAATKAEDLNRTLHALGSAIGETIARATVGIGELLGLVAVGVTSITSGIAAIGGGLVHLATGHFRGIGAAMSSAAQYGGIGAAVEFTSHMDALRRQQTEAAERQATSSVPTAAPARPGVTMQPHASSGEDPVTKQLMARVQLMHDAAAQERADLERTIAVRTRDLELQRILADGVGEETRIRMQAGELTLRAAVSERNLDREQIDRIHEIVAAMREREAHLSGAHRTTIQHDINELLAEEVALTRRVEDAVHSVAAANAARYAAERTAMDALRVADQHAMEARDAESRRTLDTMTERLRAEQERAKAESVEGARATRETERLRREQQRRLDMTQTYTERMRDLHDREASGWGSLADGVTTASGIIGNAMAKHAEAFLRDEEDIGDALQGMLSEILLSISKEATVKAALETAEGIAMLAGIYTAPLAAGHFTAAAAYAGVAALTGVGAYATRTAGMAAADNEEWERKKGIKHDGRESAARLPKGGAAGEGGGTVYNVTFGGPMYGTGGVRQAARQMVGAINRGAVQGGVQLLPGVLMGGGAGS